jgi:hypothetical protein
MRLAQLAEAYDRIVQAKAGLRLLAKALAHVDHTAEWYYEANMDRIKGALLLHTSSVCSFSRAVP